MGVDHRQHPHPRVPRHPIPRTYLRHCRARACPCAQRSLLGSANGQRTSSTAREAHRSEEGVARRSCSGRTRDNRGGAVPWVVFVALLRIANACRHPGGRQTEDPAATQAPTWPLAMCPSSLVNPSLTAKAPTHTRVPHASFPGARGVARELVHRLRQTLPWIRQRRPPCPIQLQLRFVQLRESGGSARLTVVLGMRE
jgi:hypothetical protein